MRQLTRRPRGLTLVELLTVLVIVAVLTVAGLPAFADYIENARLREAANLVVSGGLLARSEAIRRNLRVRVQVDQQRLAIVQDADGTPLRSIELPPTLQASNFVVTYDSLGRLYPFGNDRQLRLASTRRACDANIRCPAVHFEAGGEVALCPTGVCP